MVVLLLPVLGLPRSRLAQLGRRRVGCSVASSLEGHLKVVSQPMGRVEVVGPGHFERRQVGHRESPDAGDNLAFDLDSHRGNVAVGENLVAAGHTGSCRTWGVAWLGD